MNTDKHGLREVVNRTTKTFAIAFLMLVAFGGCVTRLYPYNTPSDQTLRIVSPEPLHYIVKIHDVLNDSHKTYPVGSDGIVNFHVPSLPRACSAYFLGIVKIRDNKPENLKVIELLKDGKTVRKLSLNDLSQLNMDSNGVPLLKIK